MSKSKKELKAMIAAGDSAGAARAALDYAEVCNDTEATAGIATISNTLAKDNKLWTTGQISHEDFSRAHARAAFGLSAWIDSLPDQPIPVIVKKRLEEERFKWRIFKWLVFAKMLVLLFTLYLWRTRGFTNDEAYTAFSALLPAFVAYVALMIKDFSQKEEEPSPVKRYASPRIVTIAWWLFPAYTFIQMYIVYLKVTGEITFAQMTMAVAATESILGGYIGDIVTSFFKKN